MEIYLVRHTTPNIKKGICYGQSNLEVTNSFKTEVTTIHHQIPIQEISAVYSSPLLRCKLLAETFEKPITFDYRLQELNFGRWELKAWDDIPQTELNPWMKDFVNVPVPDGESYMMLQQRVLEFFSSLQKYPHKKVLIVSHAGPIRAFLAKQQHIALTDSFDIKINYGDVIKVNV